MDSELFCKVVKGKERVGRIEAFLVLPVASLHLAVMSGGVRADQLVPDTKLSSSGFKQGRNLPLAGRETVGKLKAVVSLDTFHSDPPACIPLDQPL